MYILEVIYFTLILFTLGTILVLLRTYKKSYIGDFLVYSFAGVLFLGIIRLFFAAADYKLIHLEEDTLMICWHIMFYLTMTLFLVATRALVTVLDINNPPKSKFNPFYLSSLAGIGIVLLFYFSPAVEKNITPLFEGTWLDKTGLMHFIAFAYAGGVAHYLLGIRKKFFGSIGSVSVPLLISVALLSLIHLWELLAESWHLISLPGEMVETAESILWVPVFLFVLVAYWKLKKTLTLVT